MMMKKIVASVLLSCCLLQGRTQTAVTELTIGDQCPDVLLKQVLNHGTGELKLSDLKGKLVILDFMATNCQSCIAAFPHMEALQKEFRDKVQFIVVTKNSREEWKVLANKNKLARQLSLPLVTGDTVLSSYFPYQYLPHEVWLDGTRKVKAITGGNYVTATNMQLLIAGAEPDWPLKKDVGDYGFSAALLEPVEEQYLNGPLYYSAFTGYRQGTRSMNKRVVDTINNVVRWTVINAPVRVLYRLSIDRFSKTGIPTNRFVYELKDPAKFFADSSEMYPEKWNMENSFCYEAILPVNTSREQQLQVMLDDINRYSGYYGRKEKRRLPCYVITREGPVHHMKNAQTVSDTTALQFETYATVDDLAGSLNRFTAMLPVLNESGVGEKLNIRVPRNAINKIDEIKQALALYGLKVSKEEREVEAFVISEK